MSRRATTSITITILCMLAAMVLLGAGCGGTTTAAETTMEVPQLQSGPISGLLEDGIWVYLGIPYAAPPVDELRWREPQPVEPWEDVLACEEFGPACPQSDDDWTGMMDIGDMDEDCLYLNVWTPAKSPDERLPVMVWIHGGAFRSGAGSLPIYDGRNLAGKGVIVVTFNYRLGPLGLMAHPLLSSSSQPSFFAISSPVFSASSRVGNGFMGRPRSSMGPLSTMARSKRPSASGLAMRSSMLIPPADSPKTVTLPGSPPNAPMLSCTHSSAATWSRRP